MNQQELHKQLLEAFKIEAEERIASMFSTLTALEKSTEPESRAKMLEIVYREAHSLKGAARSVNIIPVETLCQAMESLFSDLKQETIVFTPDIFDTFHTSVGMIENFLSTEEHTRAELENTIEELAARLTAYKQTAPETLSESETLSKSPGRASEIGQHTPSKDRPLAIETDEPRAPDGRVPASKNPETPQKTAALEKSVTEPAAEPRIPAASPPARAWSTDTVRISTAKLDSLLLKTEELITLKQIMNQHLEKMHDTSLAIDKWKKLSEKSRKELHDIRRRIARSGQLDRFFDLYDMNHDQIRDTDHRINELATALDHSSRLLGAMVDDLLDEVKKTSLLPFNTLFAILPRMVRDISRDLGKDADLEVSGGDIEIDKRILEGLKDPFLHLIRNAIDHGIETPEARYQKQKSAWGKIRVSVFQPESNRVEITIADDGNGIDLDRIRKKSIKSGMLSSEQADALTDAETISLIFQSGISTSPLITEISGRGLGMAIVAEHIEHLGGLIRIASDPGCGTTFKIELPVSLSTFRGVIVSASGHDFILPVAHIEHTIRIRPEEIRTVENKSIITQNGRATSLVSLSDILGLPHAPFPEGTAENFTLPVVIFGSSEQTIACIVDHVANEQEVLVKNLGKQLKKVPNISGATILGDGRVVPILNVNELIASASGQSISRVLERKIKTKKKETQKSLLIVEDSFTSRTLLKNILEATGYRVATAIDGEDGFRQLKTGAFDAVVSDVEMPKMNGFDLTRKIRTDKLLAATPVILVTSLDSREDREQGVDAGADAYIVKSNFDQSNLLEVLKRLV